MKKYRLTAETIEHDGTILHRIQATKNFSNVKAGDLGGWVESESNLSQEGDCWLYDDSKVYKKARFIENATMYDNLCASGDILVGGHTMVGGEGEMKMEKKYQLTGETKQYNGKFLYRIEALRNFSDVKAGDLGGWVESEKNLSHEKDCWVYDDAMVYENAKIEDYAFIGGCASISGNARLSGFAKAIGSPSIYGNAKIYDRACVSGNAKVFGNVRICGGAKVFDSAMVNSNAFVSDEARVFENAHITGNACITGKACVSGNSLIFDNAVVTGTAWITGTTRLGRNATIKDEKGFINIDFLGKNLTFYKTENDIEVVHKHYSYNIKEFIQEVERKYSDTLLKQYKILIDAAVYSIS